MKNNSHERPMLTSGGIFFTHFLFLSRKALLSLRPKQNYIYMPAIKKEVKPKAEKPTVETPKKSCGCGCGKKK